MRIPKLSLYVLVILGIACDDSSSGPDASTVHVFAKLTVTDSSGAPGYGWFASLWSWPQPDSIVTPVARPRFTDDFLPLDLSGTVVADLGIFPRARIDTIIVRLQPPGCVEEELFRSLGRDLVASGETDTLISTIIFPGTKAVAVLDSGQICAFGSEGESFGPRSFRLLLIFNSITSDTSNSVVFQGRWLINYRRTSAGERGSFLGAGAPTFLSMIFTDEDGRNADCTGMRLLVTLDVEGRWVDSDLEGRPGCVENSELLSFYAGEWFPGASP